MNGFFSMVRALLRVLMAALLTWICFQYVPATEAQRRFAELPDYDYRDEGERLLEQQRFSEALLVIEAGLVSDAGGAERESLIELKARVEARRDDWLRRIGEFGEGAVAGTGDSTEALAGAVTADLFVFGDVRDLVIQGGRKLRGEETDEVIVALSAAGILLTAAPSLDLGAALLKFARKLGALSERFARQLAALAWQAADRRSLGTLGAVAEDAASLSRSARPAGAIAILRQVDDAGELARAARFAERGHDGAFALWVGDKPALNLLRGGAEHERLLLRAARKGRAGVAYAAGNARLLLAPHPLLGLLKGWYKGNVPALLQQWFRSHALMLLGLAAGWLAFELLRLPLARRGLPEAGGRGALVEPASEQPAKPQRRTPTL